MQFKFILALFLIGITGVLAATPQGKEKGRHVQFGSKRSISSLEERSDDYSTPNDNNSDLPIDISQFEQMTKTLIALIAKGGLSGDPLAVTGALENLQDFTMSTISSPKLPSALQFAAALKVFAQFVNVCQDGGSGIGVKWITKAFGGLTAEVEGVVSGVASPVLGTVTGPLAGVL
jgi:hypothetical protein